MDSCRTTTGRRAGGGAALLVAAVLALTACGGGDDEPDATSSATSAAASDDASPTAEVDPSEAASDEDAPASVGEFCAPYVEMVESLETVDFKAGNEEIAREMAPVMRAWAEQVPDLERPPGLDDEVWEGLTLLVERIEALPEEPTYAELEDVEQGLPPAKKKQISTASTWFTENCAFEE